MSAAILLLAVVIGGGRGADPAAAGRELRQGLDFLRQESFARAEDALRAATTHDPTLAEAHYALGQVYMATRRYREAVAAYTRSGQEIQLRRATAPRPDWDLEGHRLRLRGTAAHLEARGASDAALEKEMARLEPQRATERRPRGLTPGMVHLALGSALFRSGSLEGAEQSYRAAVAADHRSAEAHNNLAVVLMLTGRAAEAMGEARAAEDAGFRLDPRFKADLARSLTTQR